MGALIPLAISLAPELGKFLFGDKGQAVAASVAQIAQTLTGTTDEAAASAAIAASPPMAAQLRVQLAQIAAQQEQAARQAEVDELTARLKDMQDARAQTLGLARAGSAVQWAPVIVSTVVLATFALVMWAALTRSLPPGSETILNMLLGTLAAMATSAVAYWLGSSSGSAEKTRLLYRSTPTDAAPPQ